MPDADNPIDHAPYAGLKLTADVSLLVVGYLYAGGLLVVALTLHARNQPLCSFGSDPVWNELARSKWPAGLSGSLTKTAGFRAALA